MPIKVFTPEMEKYLKEHYSLLPYSKLCIEMSEKFNVKIGFECIRGKVRRMGLKKTKEEKRVSHHKLGHQWSKYEDELISKMKLSGISNKEIAKKICVSEYSVKARLHKLGVHIIDKEFEKKKNILSEEMISWISNYLIDHSWMETYKEYKKTFGCDVQIYQFVNIAHNNGIYVSNEKKHQINSANGYKAGKSCIGREPATKKYYYGQIMILRNEKYICISENKGRDFKKNFIALQVYLYQKYHNIIVDRKNQCVIFKDGNKDNFSKENLFLITRSENSKLIRFHQHGLGRATESSISVIRVERLVDQFKKENHI